MTKTQTVTQPARTATVTVPVTTPAEEDGGKAGAAVAGAVAGAAAGSSTETVTQTATVQETVSRAVAAAPTGSGGSGADDELPVWLIGLLGAAVGSVLTGLVIGSRRRHTGAAEPDAKTSEPPVVGGSA